MRLCTDSYHSIIIRGEAKEAPTRVSQPSFKTCTARCGKTSLPVLTLVFLLRLLETPQQTHTGRETRFGGKKAHHVIVLEEV
jgi:hypothetical protein